MTYLSFVSPVFLVVIVLFQVFLHQLLLFRLHCLHFLISPLLLTFFAIPHRFFRLPNLYLRVLQDLLEFLIQVVLDSAPAFDRLDPDLQPVMPLNGGPLNALLFVLGINLGEELVQLSFHHLVECYRFLHPPPPVHYRHYEHTQQRRRYQQVRNVQQDLVFSALEAFQHRHQGYHCQDCRYDKHHFHNFIHALLVQQLLLRVTLRCYLRWQQHYRLELLLLQLVFQVSLVVTMVKESGALFVGRHDHERRTVLREKHVVHQLRPVQYLLRLRLLILRIVVLSRVSVSIWSIQMNR